MRPRDTREWLGRAACRGRDTGRWDTPHGLPRHFVNGRRAEVAAVLSAGRVCDGCPVAAECAADALRCHDHTVIRAGIPLPDREADGGRGVLARCRAALALVSAGAAPAQARAVLLDEVPPVPRPKQGGWGAK